MTWLLTVAAAAVSLMLWLAAPAAAHASLLATTPAAGYSVSSSPTALTLVFDQPVSVQASPVQLAGCRSGRRGLLTANAG